MSTKWNILTTCYDTFRAAIPFKTRSIGPREFYLKLLKELLESGADPQDADELLAEYLFIKTNRKTWLIDDEMVSLLRETPIDENLEGVFFPYDVIGFSFQNNCYVGEFPFRNALMFMPRCQLTYDIFSKDIASGSDVMRGRYKDKMFFIANAGDDGEGNYSHGARLCVKWRNLRLLSKRNLISDMDGMSRPEIDAFREMLKICVSAMLYYAARPELIQDIGVTIQARKSDFRSPRGQYSILKMPEYKVATSENASSQGSGRVVRPHYRGWVLRTLRHERYKRNPDGSIKVVLVPPCAIHGDRM